MRPFESRHKHRGTWRCMGGSITRSITGGPAVTRQYSTDVYISCPCPSCQGAEVRITARRYRNLCRLASPAHEQAIHETVARTLAASRT